MAAEADSGKWLPKSVQCLAGYNGKMLTSDLISGLTVGLVALPLAMAFGISSGVTPQAGIYTAVVAGFIISALGGSRCQIGGPTGAFVVIVAGIIQKYGLNGLFTVTGMAGAMLVFMGLTGLGSAVRFIPRPVTIGFTNGIAILIASTQIKDFLGLSMPGNPGEFTHRMRAIAEHIGTVNPATVALASASLAVVLLWPRVTRRVPGSIVALLLGTLVVALLKIPVETIGSRFGGIPTGLPRVEIPPFEFQRMGELLPAAFTVAMLAAIESLLSAVVADSMSGDKHNPNVELVAQGVANLAVPFVGGIPATGAIARTATNIRASALTPVSGMVHALVLVLILVVAAPVARFIPLCTLAAVLFVVAYNMGEWREVGGILRLTKTDRSVWAATFILTVFADLTVAVQIGMVMAALLHIYRVAQTTTVSRVTDDYIEEGREHTLQDKDIPDHVTIIRIHGPFLFGCTEKLVEETSNLATLEPVVILRLRNMTALDASGLHAIETLASRLRQSGRTLLLCGARDQPGKVIQQSGVVHHIGAENILPTVAAALERARVLAP